MVMLWTRWRTESRQRDRVGAAFFTIMESSRLGMVASDISAKLQAVLTRLTPLGCAEAHPYNCWVVLNAVAQLETAFSWAWLLASWERWARSIWRRRSRV